MNPGLFLFAPGAINQIIKKMHVIPEVCTFCYEGYVKVFTI